MIHGLRLAVDPHAHSIRLACASYRELRAVRRLTLTPTSRLTRRPRPRALARGLERSVAVRRSTKPQGRATASAAKKLWGAILPRCVRERRAIADAIKGWLYAAHQFVVGHQLLWSYHCACQYPRNW